MNRSPKELIDALAFALENGGIDTLLIGDNEAARLVMDWRKKDHILKNIDVIGGDFLDNPPKPTPKLAELLNTKSPWTE